MRTGDRSNVNELGYDKGGETFRGGFLYHNRNLDIFSSLDGNNTSGSSRFVHLVLPVVSSHAVHRHDGWSMPQFKAQDLQRRQEFEEIPRPNHVQPR